MLGVEEGETEEENGQRGGQRCGFLVLYGVSSCHVFSRGCITLSAVVLPCLLFSCDDKRT